LNKLKYEKNPYHVYSINNAQINYQYFLEGIQFLLNPVQKKDLTVR